MIFAVPQFVEHDALVPATSWFWSQDEPGPWVGWVAVDADVENIDDWFGDVLPDHAPDVVEIPVDQDPPTGVLRWIDEDGKHQERWITPEPGADEA